MSDEDAYKILDDAHTNEWIIEKIFDTITDYTGK